MEILSLVVAILAFLLSITVAVIEYKRDFKINRKNLEADYFNEIYKKHLISNIPNARKYIRFDSSGHLKDIDNMCIELNEIRTDSLYYLYNDKKFYDKLKSHTQKLEDYLILSSSRIFEGESQTEFMISLQEELKELYKIINNKYII